MDLVASWPDPHQTVNVSLNVVAAIEVKGGGHLIFQSQYLSVVERLMSLIVVTQTTLAKLLVIVDRIVLLDDLHLIVPVLPPLPVIVVQQISEARIFTGL